MSIFLGPKNSGFQYWVFEEGSSNKLQKWQDLGDTSLHEGPIELPSLQHPSPRLNQEPYNLPAPYEGGLLVTWTLKNEMFAIELWQREARWRRIVKLLLRLIPKWAELPHLRRRHSLARAISSPSKVPPWTHPSDPSISCRRPSQVASPTYHNPGPVVLPLPSTTASSSPAAGTSPASPTASPCSKRIGGDLFPLQSSHRLEIYFREVCKMEGEKRKILKK
nr:glycylpeptide N-tetradecanoyltransferase 1-like [Ipomoea batatas]